jgi:hypothetical protein
MRLERKKFGWGGEDSGGYRGDAEGEDGGRKEGPVEHKGVGDGITQ